MKIKDTAFGILKGAGIGIACIIPGVSGGTIAVILGIYDQILAAISNLRRDFKNSFKVLWPIVLGIVLGLVAMVYPLTLALEHLPLATVTLFVGLIIGGLPGLLKKVDQRPTIGGAGAFLAALALAVGLCFVSSGSQADLSVKMDWWLYPILVLVGVVGSAALTIPGISGSMLLLILGFWKPILEAVQSLLTISDFGHNLLVLALFGIGVIIGFFLISKLMTFLFKRYSYLTYMAIVGFIFGSIFAIFYSIKDNVFPAGITPLVAVIIAVIAGLLGLAVSGYLSFYSLRHQARLQSAEKGDDRQEDDEAR